MDIFEQITPIQGEHGEGYGRSGEMKKTQYMLQLLGTPWDPATLKCIIAASEQGMEMRAGYLDTLSEQHKSKEYTDIFEFGTYPGLKESDYYLAGVNGILAFINARGLGFSLIPKNVNKAAEQDYWIDIALTEAEPAVKQIVQEKIVATLEDPSYKADEEKLSEARKSIAACLDALNQQLGSDSSISDKYSMADVHWLALVHLLILSGESDLVNQRTNIKRWYDSMATRKSNCGQDIIAFSHLPTIEDIQNKQIADVEISDF